MALRRELGRNIGAWRKLRGYTQEDAAERAGCSVGTVSQVESGEQGYSPETLDAFARAYGVTIGQLLMAPPSSTEDPAPLSVEMARTWEALRAEDKERILIMSRALSQASH